MTRYRNTAIRIVVTAFAFGVMTVLGGCAYDYLTHSGRIAYSSGDAVRANLESETANPSSRSTYDTSGLGRNGPVVQQ